MILAILVVVKWYILVLICVFLMTNNVAHTFICFRSSVHICQYVFWSIAYILIGLFIFLLVSCNSSLCRVGKIGLQLWECKSLFLYYYLLIVLFYVRTAVNVLLPYPVYSGYKSLIRYTVCKYFLPFCGFSFYFLSLLSKGFLRLRGGINANQPQN